MTIYPFDQRYTSLKTNLFMLKKITTFNFVCGIKVQNMKH